jgi:hypothetical protein
MMPALAHPYWTDSSFFLLKTFSSRLTAKEMSLSALDKASMVQTCCKKMSFVRLERARSCDIFTVVVLIGMMDVDNEAAPTRHFFVLLENLI